MGYVKRGEFDDYGRQKKRFLLGRVKIPEYWVSV